MFAKFEAQDLIIVSERTESKLRNREATDNAMLTLLGSEVAQKKANLIRNNQVECFSCVVMERYAKI